MRHPFLHATPAIAALLAIAAPRALAGDLAPPAGPVAPTHKTLTHVEPRTPLSAATTPGDGNSVFRIAQSGSYYLTANATAPAGFSAIEIAASNVTLDLMGFEVVGAASTISGVAVNSAVSGITIRGGTIRNWTGDGVGANLVPNVALERVVLRANAGNGAILGHSARVHACTAEGNGALGFLLDGGPVVTDSLAHGNTDSGFGVTIESFAAHASFSNCVARGNGQAGFEAYGNAALTNCAAGENLGDGIVVGTGGVIRGCTAFENGGAGINTVFTLPPSTVTGGQLIVAECAARLNAGDGIRIGTSNASVINCVANFNTLNGINVGGSCMVRGNNCVSNGSGGDGAGILVRSGDCRVEGNNVSSNDRGIDVDVSGNIIFANTAAGNISNYEIVANNKVGVIISAPNSVAISGSTGGAGLGSTDPWANFSF